MKLTLEEIAKLIDAKIYGESSKEIIGINTLTSANSDQISHAVSQKYKKSLINSNAGAVIIDKKLVDYCSSNAL
jgi:UDP-3-O-[3-hydroxymyristoyl] glucosamine N-acyltransferase